jgi:hypothetical protein
MQISLNTENMESPYRQPVKMLFAGGCHVAGYPIGEEQSFPTIVKEELFDVGMETEVHRLSHLKVTHHSRILAMCKELRPEVLVLQLGHFELSQSLSSYLRSPGTGRDRRSSADALSIPACCIRSASLFYLRAFLKTVLDSMLGHPLVDFLRFQENLTVLARELEQCRIPLTVMLTPLGCADPMTLYYRKRCIPFYRQAAGECGATVLDVLKNAPAGRQRRLGAEHYYYDAIHLGEAGHRMVGQAISCHLQKVLTSCMVKESAR